MSWLHMTFAWPDAEDLETSHKVQEKKKLYKELKL